MTLDTKSDARPACRAFVVAGPSSGAGKTTVALGLMAALRARGMVVQPFKCGPDFIDPGHHAQICARASRNLDTWMVSPAINRDTFQRYSTGADVSVVEGVMGLFDGAPGTGAGSTAATARLLDLPVILVVDAAGMGASGPPQPPKDSATELLEAFDSGVTRLKSAIAAVDAAKLREKWTMRMGPRVLVSESRAMLMRLMVINHLVHHRAQLGVYLRLLNVAIPGMYGPSADELV